MINENFTDMSEVELRHSILKIIDLAAIRAKNYRSDVMVPGGFIKLSVMDISYLSSILSNASLDNEFSNLQLQYVDDEQLSIKHMKINIHHLRDIISFLSNLSLRIDLKASYRKHLLAKCVSVEDMLNLLNIITEEEDHMLDE